jgi:DNA-binding CsgD family transcriptional regulator
MQTVLSDVQAHVHAPSPLSEAELSAILHARDWVQLRERTRRALQVFGIDDFALKMDIIQANGSMLTHRAGTLPASLLNRDRDQGATAADPIDRHIRESGLPHEWDINDVCSATEADAYLELLMYGVRGGISMAVRTERACTRVDFYRKSAAAFSRSPALRANLMLIASHLHEAARCLRGTETIPRGEALTKRELECLRYSAGGKTGKEIGMILGISQRTVYFHMKNIATKFNVYSTRHAIGRAVAAGLIRPGG